MKKVFLAFAKFNEESNKVIAAELGKLDNKEREKNRKSHFGSLSEIFRHNTGATVYFLSLYKTAVLNNADAIKALEALSKITMLKGNLTEDQWKKAVANSKIADKALIEFISALKDRDFEASVEVNWYKGKPPAAPLWFMLQQQVTHNTHHRGQISQIFDSLKIENDFSGINIKFL